MRDPSATTSSSHHSLQLEKTCELAGKAQHRQRIHEQKFKKKTNWAEADFLKAEADFHICIFLPGI